MNKLKDILLHKNANNVYATSTFAAIGAAMLFSQLDISTEYTNGPLTETEHVILQSYNAAAAELIEERVSFSGSQINENAAITLNSLHEIGSDFDAASASMESARFKSHQADVDKFLDILAKDSNLKESYKGDVLRQLTTNNVIPENHAAAETSARYLDECRIDNSQADDIYSCSAELTQEFNDGKWGRAAPFIGLIVLLLTLSQFQQHAEYKRGQKKQQYRH